MCVGLVSACGLEFVVDNIFDIYLIYTLNIVETALSSCNPVMNVFKQNIPLQSIVNSWYFPALFTGYDP